MTEPRCEKTELPKSGCAHCRGHETPVDVDGPRRRGFSFTAAWPGRCVVCADRIDTGDDITRVVDSTGYAHDTCIPLDAR